MNVNIENLIKVYQDYGFELKHEGSDILCFLYKKGRYFGVDLIGLDDKDETKRYLDETKLKYSKLGYAVNEKGLLSNKEFEDELFKSFFSYDSTRWRLIKKYQDFISKQTKSLLGNQYEYIESPYDIVDDMINSDIGLIKMIETILSYEDPQLIIIEAAAGYGKTCAAYEILNLLTKQKDKIITPLFTELSKNRGANIFKYVLLDEIDTEFPTLNSGLVIHEIKNGRVPLIIDGFDELLDKVNITNIDESYAFEEIESMLDTIGNLLEKNAKIILTTRKTAIFSGTEFEKWFNKWNNKFHVTRFSLKEPRIKDWLGEERFSQIKEIDFPIQYIANPVLLSYLKHTSFEDFNWQINNPESLINQYFNRILEREKERQNLIITVDKQYEIFKNVARMLLEFDIVVESKEFFKDIIRDQNSKLLEYTRTLYSGQNKPTLENLLDTLATHALLDRKGRNETQIGFINDFVFGIFIGEIICESKIEKIEKDYSFYMLDLACTAYKVQHIDNKKKLWEKVNLVTNKLQPESIFNYDIILREKLTRDHLGLTLYDAAYYNVSFNNYLITNTVFLNCLFKNCSFDTTIFNGVSFIDCTFDNCRVLDELYLDAPKQISTIKCKVKDCYILEHYDYPPPEQEHIFSTIEHQILKKVCEMSGTKSHHIVKLLSDFNKNQHKEILQSLNSLEERDYLKIKGSNIYLNINKIKIIRTELGL